MMREWYWVIAALTLFLAGYGLQQMKLFQGDRPVTVVSSGCDLRQGNCELLNAGGQRFRFSIEPKHIPVMQPLTLSLVYPVEKAHQPIKVSIEFEGLNMDMGYNRVFLQAREPSVYSAVAMIPACTAEQMLWKIHLLIEDRAGITDYQMKLVTKNQ